MSLLFVRYSLILLIADCYCYCYCYGCLGCYFENSRADSCPQSDQMELNDPIVHPKGRIGTGQTTGAGSDDTPGTLITILLPSCHMGVWLACTFEISHTDADNRVEALRKRFAMLQHVGSIFVSQLIFTMKVLAILAAGAVSASAFAPNASPLRYV